MDFKPTITRTQLLANNTSASDSFLGWLPGLPKASAIGLSPFDIPQKKLVHRCDWWGYGNHPNIGIKSNDPLNIKRTIADMLARGFNGYISDWYGEGSNEDKSLLAMKIPTEQAGMEFALCVDSGTHAIKNATTDAERTTALIGVLSYARKTYFSSPSYLKHNGKLVVLFFGFSTSGFDWKAVKATVSDCLLIFRWETSPQYSDRPYADGYFGWTNNTESWITNVKTHAPGKLIILGVNGRFNNTDPVICPWGVGKNKVIDAQGGLTLENNLAVARAHPEIVLTSFNTWNDYQEKSALEPGIPSGKSLTLVFSDVPNTLSWVDPGPVFDHLILYISQDGENLMPIADGIRGVTLITLAGYSVPVGPWKFLLAAIGKNSIQNIVSNTLSLNEFTDWK